MPEVGGRRLRAKCQMPNVKVQMEKFLGGRKNEL